ncbi:hypothetical protein FB567DRAFT_528513 [Paraphoma chrysanthemicola]|uniref:Uncharacterized protein n=1 Tax=Paraphoma chrysanthemicola TaxID=798071 RepID=A0A8K0VWL8_9PLEO|nr:hypothetical protein FB567DRAFT_528513 [Paraphoma chrysanthemicola]
MATSPKSGHQRADSGVEGIDSASKALLTAQNFYNAVTSLTSEKGFQAFSDLLELLPRQETEIKVKDAAIHDLNDKLEAKEKSHKAFIKKQVLAFEDRYDDWTDENSTLEDRVEELEKAARVKDEEVMMLRKTNEEEVVRLRDVIKHTEEKNTDLEAAYESLTKASKEFEKRVVNLEATLQKSQAESEDRAQKIEELNDRIADMKKTLDEGDEKYRCLNAEAIQSKEALMGMLQYCVTLNELDLTETAGRIDAIWKSAINFVVDFAGGELPDHTLQSDWTKIRDNEVFQHRIPLPQSNSEVAREMRVAIILGILATLINNVIFQPTYLVSHEDHGLRENLCHQAFINAEQEQAGRSALLAMLPEEQEENEKEGIDYVATELLDGMNVQVLLSPENVLIVRQALEQLLLRFQQEWKIIQRGREKLEVSFQHSFSADYPWHVLDLRASNAKPKKNSHAKPSSTSLEDKIVVVPRLYHIKAQDGGKPLTHGYVLQKAHLNAAETELSKILPADPFERSGPSRTRNRGGRKMSVAGSTTSSGRGLGRFLSQPRGGPTL